MSNIKRPPAVDFAATRVGVHTHPLNNGVKLSRLNRFRLKDAERRRDEAIQRAHDQYAHEVEMLLHRSDRHATAALAAGKPANSFWWPWRDGPVTPDPSLADPFGHELPTGVRVVLPEDVLLSKAGRAMHRAFGYFTRG